jgi:exonuclease SbcD
LRLLHAADLHLGARFHDQPRGEEEQQALDQICRLCAEENVDAVLLAGDIFDTANPGAEEQRRYYGFLSSLVRDAGVGTVVVVGGNHDSALRLEGPRELLATLRIHVVGRLPRDGDAGDCRVELQDRSGSRRALCAAVPYLRDGDLRLARPGETVTEAHQRYAEALAARYEEARRAAGPGLPLVVMGHCFAAGAGLGGGERPVQVGNLGLVRAEALAGDAAYLALGHLHRPQALAGRAHWRYSGSLLPTGFDEVGLRREIVLADLPADGSPAAVRPVPLAPYRRYARAAGNPAESQRALEDLPEPGPGEPAPWCEVTVDLDGPRPGLAQELAQTAANRGWVAVSVVRRWAGASAGPILDEEAGLETLAAEEVFARCHEATYGAPPDGELAAEFRRLLEDLETPARGS